MRRKAGRLSGASHARTEFIPLQKACRCKSEHDINIGITYIESFPCMSQLSLILKHFIISYKSPAGLLLNQ